MCVVCKNQGIPEQSNNFLLAVLLNEDITCGAWSNCRWVDFLSAIHQIPVVWCFSMEWCKTLFGK